MKTSLPENDRAGYERLRSWDQGWMQPRISGPTHTEGVWMKPDSNPSSHRAAHVSKALCKGLQALGMSWFALNQDRPWVLKHSPVRDTQCGNGVNGLWQCYLPIVCLMWPKVALTESRLPFHFPVWLLLESWRPYMASVCNSTLVFPYSIHPASQGWSLYIWMTQKKKIRNLKLLDS